VPLFFQRKFSVQIIEHFSMSIAGPAEDDDDIGQLERQRFGF